MPEIALRADFSAVEGPIKDMYSINNGPKPRAKTQVNSNYESYTALHIPFARNHDAAGCSSYGGPHIVDVHQIFPNFDADENDPASYDFFLTDLHIESVQSTGTKVFYRLGATIEHAPKKYGVLPPKDFAKWARICEHIIRHLNEGWADGRHFGIEYWEIWNEPDLKAEDVPPEDKKTWGGTYAQFYDFYEIAAKHLKKCFPNLKIGGPSAAWVAPWLDQFLTVMQERNVPMDFLTWHGYMTCPEELASYARTVRSMMDAHGYGQAESMLAEWNYIKGWTDEFVYSLEVIQGIKGAAFTASCMLTGQHSPVDRLMYYDAMGGFCGLWDSYCRTLPTYYGFLMFSRLYELGTSVKTEVIGKGVYTVAAKNADGKKALMIAAYTDDDADTEMRAVTLSDMPKGTYRLTTLDGKEQFASRNLLTLRSCDCVLLEWDEQERP